MTSAHKLTDGMREVPWPNKPPPDRWKQARQRGNSSRRGEFSGEPRSDEERAAWEGQFTSRRIRCAIAELYQGFGGWISTPNGEVRALHMQAAIKAHAALKSLGGDRILKLTDPG